MNEFFQNMNKTNKAVHDEYKLPSMQVIYGSHVFDGSMEMLIERRCKYEFLQQKDILTQVLTKFK